MATVNCLVTKIFQNIFCAQQRKETHAVLEQLGVSKHPIHLRMTEFSFLGEICF